MSKLYELPFFANSGGLSKALLFVGAMDAQLINQKEFEMRELTLNEMQMVSGAGDECSSGGGNDLGGISDSKSLGEDLINIYEGLVAATSHIIERVANSF